MRIRNPARPGFSRNFSLENLEPRLALAAAPVGDLAEANASQWGAFASDYAMVSVIDDPTLVKSGNASLKFVTASGFDTGVSYPMTASASWDLTTVNYLTFWARAENNTPVGFQGNQPVVELNTPAGSFSYTPDTQLLTNYSWVKVRVPLTGGGGWTRTSTGSPLMTDVSQLLIHDDTWDSGFTINFDRVQFEQLDPNGLPPAGPAPPSGVNPDAIQPKVLLYIFDPIMENLDGQRLHAAYGWLDPVALTQQIVADFATSSHGLANYQIVETQIVDAQPYFEDGFQNTDASFVVNWTNREFHESSHFDYLRFASENNLVARVDAGEIDEVWVYAPPIGGLWESVMAGAGAYWINGPTQAVPSQRAFAIMGWNYERGVGEAIHSFGHRAESIMAHIYGSWTADQSHNWNRFAALDKDQPGLGGVGNVHFPVNGTSDYDYFNQQYVLSNADDWANYPNFTGATRSINALEWSPLGVDAQREYLNWWYAHMPHFAGRGTDFYLNNWWRYLTDVDQFKAGSANLHLTEGQPRVMITAPGTVTASSTALIRAAVDVDGAAGRVDFYVDGVYAASDDLAPYTFGWSTVGVIGQHRLVAKAYELQNGTEGISEEATIQVPGTIAQHAAAGDFSQDGVTDGLDFLVWQRRLGTDDPTADANSNGLVEWQDLTIWGSRFGAGLAAASVEPFAAPNASRSGAAALLDAVYAGGDFASLFPDRATFRPVGKVRLLRDCTINSIAFGTRREQMFFDAAIGHRELSTEQRPQLIVIGSDPEIRASNRHVRVSSRIPVLSQRPPARPRMGDECVTLVMNGERR